MVVGAASLWGWGSTARRFARVTSASAALEIALGLAAVLVVGGVLNCLRLSYGPVLDAVLIVGIALTLKERHRLCARWRARTTADCLALFPLVGMAVFLAAYLTPAAGFNWHDDLERYFSYPVRMLATGTIAGHPLGYIGADTLGGQPFLQEFVGAHFRISYIASVDVGFCLLLCMAVAGFGLRPRGWGLTAVVAELLVVAINPLVVNISSVFTTALLLSGLVLLT